MSGFSIVLLVLQIISAIAIICLVLLQHGKGADMGAAFGSGSAGSIFGSAGSANFLSRMTSTAVTVFFVTTLAISFLSYKALEFSGSVFDAPDSASPTAPANTIPAGTSGATPTTQSNPESSQPTNVDQIPTN